MSPLIEHVYATCNDDDDLMKRTKHDCQVFIEDNVLIYGDAYSSGFVVQSVIRPPPVDLAEPFSNEIVQSHVDKVQDGEALYLVHAHIACTYDKSLYIAGDQSRTGTAR
jgi:hypothetical protein